MIQGREQMWTPGESIRSPDGIEEAKADGKCGRSGDDLSGSGLRPVRRLGQPDTVTLCTGIYLTCQFYSHITFQVCRKADIGAVKRPGCGLQGIMTDAENKGEGRGAFRDHKRAFIIMPLPASGACLSRPARCPASSGVLSSPDMWICRAAA